MKYPILTLLALTLLTGACNKERHAVYFDNEWHESYQYYKGYILDTFTNASTGALNVNMPKGNGKTVFDYSNGSGIYDDVYDNEYSGSLRFQVDSGASSFSYTDGQLKDNFTYYSGGGAWSGYAPVLLDKGIISGAKQSDDSWIITVDVVLPKPDDIAKISTIRHSTRYTYQALQ